MLDKVISMYKFFEDFSTAENNFLITDNVQIAPFPSEAKQTSPTNLGFLLLSHVCAAELEIITREEAEARIFRTLETIEKLEKFEGNLYNWYDVKTMQALPPRKLSSVDCANFLACLYVADGFLRAVSDRPYTDKLHGLINSINLQIFYNETRGLYSITYDPKTGEREGCYDLLASEARLLAYLGVARGGELSAWENMSRYAISYGGNTLVSWSGTAFEYLLPQIFLPDVAGSMLTKSVKAAVKLQIKNKCKGVFGISESGFYDFDDAMHYKYHAFGLEEISLRRGFNRCVISPYSSFLMLGYNPKAAIKNLEKLKTHGADGKYGFFEAVDFTKDKKIVQSHMAHHLGMSIAAATNFLTGGVLQKYFMSAPETAGAHLLLTERPPRSACPKKVKSEFVYDPEAEDVLKKVFRKPASERRAHILGDGKYGVFADGDGGSLSFSDKTFINRVKRVGSSGVFAYFKEAGGEVWATSKKPLMKTADYETAFRDEEITYKNLEKEASQTLIVPSGLGGEVRHFKLSGEPRALEVFLYADLQMTGFEAGFSHPVFDNMFVSTKFLPEENAIIAKRTARGRGGDFYAAMVVSCGVGLSSAQNIGKAEKVTPETNKFNFIGRLRDERSPQIVGAVTDRPHLYPSTGDVLEPCFGAKFSVKTPCEFTVTMLYGADLARLTGKIKEACAPQFLSYAKSANEILRGGIYKKHITDGEKAELLLKFLAENRMIAPKPGDENALAVLEFLRASGLEVSVKVEEGEEVCFLNFLTL